EYVGGLPGCRDAGFDALVVLLPCGGDERFIDDRSSDRAVSAEAHMIFAADVDRVLEVADQVLGVRLPRESQKRHEIDPGHPAAIGKGFELLVMGVARQVDERPAA